LVVVAVKAAVEVRQMMTAESSKPTENNKAGSQGLP
jgi:hypothetical protein